MCKLHEGKNKDIRYYTDKVTRYVYITYKVPENAPDLIKVHCFIQGNNEQNRRQACVWPYISETAMSLISDTDWENSVMQGVFTERAAAGLERTVIWNPFLQGEKNFKGKFKVVLYHKKRIISTKILDIKINNKDVILINDWDNVLQKRFVDSNIKSESKKWWIKKHSNNKRLIGEKTLEVKQKNVELPQLTYPLNLNGTYAIFVSLPPKLGSIELRLSSDERVQKFHHNKTGFEYFWKWADLTRCHLVIKQPWNTVYEYEDENKACLDTVRLVPLDCKTLKDLNGKIIAENPNEKKLIVGYNEPYSWAFCENVQNNLQHMEPLIAFAESGVDRIDIQIGRAGSKMCFETRKADQDINMAYGDPVRGKVPITANVGRMQQYTNMLSTQLKYSNLLNMKSHANMGATGCYKGTPAEAQISKKHPEWTIDNCLRYDIPQVVDYILNVFEETIQIGARSLSVDWCRYPDSISRKETVTEFFRSLRALANKYEKKLSEKIKILTRFPAKGVRKSEYMDYKTWIKEGLIDYLCPSNIQGRHMHFDIAEYVEAVKDTDTKLLPCVDGLLWGLAFPGMYLNRVLECYEHGADGIYIYQCDALVWSASRRRHVMKLGYPELLNLWSKTEKINQHKYSKNIYITTPMIGEEHGESKYYPCERLRVWCEGIEPERVELYVDDVKINEYTSSPYILASEEYKDDSKFESGKHTLKVKAYYKNRVLQKEFRIEFA